MAAVHAGGGAIDADAVYATTGQPRPMDVEAIAGVLLNSPFRECVAKVSQIKTERGLALADIVRQGAALYKRFKSVLKAPGFSP